MLGSLILYLKGMRIMMFQLSGYYCECSFVQGPFRFPHKKGLTSPHLMAGLNVAARVPFKDL